MKNKEIVLNNGYIIPMIGISMHNNFCYRKSHDLFIESLNLGYRYFDVCDEIFSVGCSFADIFKSGRFKRNDIIISCNYMYNYYMGLKNYIDYSCKYLKIDFIDIFITQWPVKCYRDEKSEFKYTDSGMPIVDINTSISRWEKHKELLDSSKIKCIGISNVGVGNMAALSQYPPGIPQINQFDYHPYQNQTELVQKCIDNDIVVIASSPLGRTREMKNKIMNDPTILDIALRTSMTPSQVVLSYTNMRNIVVLPTPTNSEQLKEYITFKELSIYDFNLISKVTNND